MFTLSKVTLDECSLSTVVSDVRSRIRCIFTHSKVGQDVHTFKSGIGCMFTLSKVASDVRRGIDVCLHFQKWDKIYVHTFKSGIGCMFTLPKVAFDVSSRFQKWHYVCTFKCWIKCTHFLKCD